MEISQIEQEFDALTYKITGTDSYIKSREPSFVEPINETVHNRQILAKNIINKLLTRYNFYKSDITYNCNSSIDFQFTIYINGNTLTISYDGYDFISMSDTISIGRFIENPSLIDAFISRIDTDLYALTYLNA